MKILYSLMLAFLLGCSSLSTAQAGTEGLALELPGDLELTFEVLPFYDDEQRVIAGWKGGELQYFLVVEPLAAGQNDAGNYFDTLLQRLRPVWSDVRLGEIQRYSAASGLQGSLAVLEEHPADGSQGVSQVMHFLTDGEHSFLAVATLMANVPLQPVVEQTLEVMATARSVAAHL